MKTLFKTTLAFSLILAIICTSVICCFAESTVTEENTSVTLFISVTNRNGEKLDGHHIRLTDFSKNTIDEWVSTKTSHKTVVPSAGIYYLEEYTVASDYYPNDVMEINVPASSETMAVNFQLYLLAPPIARHIYTIKDVLRIQRHLAFYDQIPTYDYYYLDTDKNDRIDINDATLIQQHLAEMIQLNEYFTC